MAWIVDGRTHVLALFNGTVDVEVTPIREGFFMFALLLKGRGVMTEEVAGDEASAKLYAVRKTTNFLIGLAQLLWIENSKPLEVSIDLPTEIRTEEIMLPDDFLGSNS